MSGIHALALLLTLLIAWQGVQSKVQQAAALSAVDPLAASVICQSIPGADAASGLPNPDRPSHHHDNCDGLCPTACRHLVSPNAPVPTLAIALAPAAYSFAGILTTADVRADHQRRGTPQAARAPPIV